MAAVLWPLPLRHQYLDLLADQFVAGVAEQSLCLGVRLNNHALAVHGDHGVRNCFQNARG